MTSDIVAEVQRAEKAEAEVERLTKELQQAIGFQVLAERSSGNAHVEANKLQTKLTASEAAAKNWQEIAQEYEDRYFASEAQVKELMLNLEESATRNHVQLERIRQVDAQVAAARTLLNEYMQATQSEWPAPEWIQVPDWAPVLAWDDAQKLLAALEMKP